MPQKAAGRGARGRIRKEKEIQASWESGSSRAAGTREQGQVHGEPEGGRLSLRKVHRKEEKPWKAAKQSPKHCWRI